MILNGQRFRTGMNVRTPLLGGPGGPAGGPRFAYHALFGAVPGVRGRTSGFSGNAAGGWERGVPVYLPPVPNLPGVDMAIEVAGVPATATLSAGRALPSGAWVLARDEAHGLRLLPAPGRQLSGPVTLRVTVTATDRATGRVASLSASIEVAAPWDGGPSAGGAAVRYSLADDAGGRFEIDPVTGLVTVADESLLDHATARSHRIMVQTISDRGAISTRRYEITLLDDAGQFSIADVVDGMAADSLAPKHAAAGAVVGTVAVAIDADAADSVRFRLTDDAGGRFAIDASTGVVTVADASLLDWGAVPSHSIAVEVAETGGWISAQRFAIARGAAKGQFIVTAELGEVPTAGRAELPRSPADMRHRLPAPVTRYWAAGVAA